MRFPDNKIEFVPAAQEFSQSLAVIRDSPLGTGQRHHDRLPKASRFWLIVRLNLFRGNCGGTRGGVSGFGSSLQTGGPEYGLSVTTACLIRFSSTWSGFSSATCFGAIAGCPVR
jgi:hypothetical protein